MPTEEELSVDEIAQRLHVSANEAERLLIDAKVPVLRQSMFSEQKRWKASDVCNSLKDLTAKIGMEEHDAALELGLTSDSYKELVKKLPLSSKGRVLKELLEAYRNKFLPRRKSWSTRTSLLKEFVDNFNRENPTSPIAVQPCEVDSCDNAASAQCKNTSCRKSERPRFVCPAHEEWIDEKNMRGRPKALCPVCAKKVRDGKLPEFQLL